METQLPRDSKPPDVPQFVFKLFITGDKPRDRFTAKSLRRLCDDLFQGNYQLTVVDALQKPEQAKAEKILATPTLIREAPAPAQRIVGDLCASRDVLDAWGLVKQG